PRAAQEHVDDRLALLRRLEALLAQVVPPGRLEIPVAASGLTPPFPTVPRGRAHASLLHLIEQPMDGRWGVAGFCPASNASRAAGSSRRVTLLSSFQLSSMRPR